MAEDVFAVPDEVAANAHVNAADYEEMYAASISDPDGFWRAHGTRIDWIKPYTVVKDVSYHEKDFRIGWYTDGVLNVSANCIDRHLEARGDKTAILWEGDDPSESKAISYAELHLSLIHISQGIVR